MNKLAADNRQIIDAAIRAVRPDALIRQKVKRERHVLSIGGLKTNLKNYARIFIVGAGKASAFMAREMEALLGENLSGGIVSVKYGHGTDCKKVKILEAGHPVIDRNTLAASDEILRLLDGAGEKDLILCLLSGGGSALLESLPGGILLSDLQQTFEQLLGCGAKIEEINTVRKHLSRVKGGQLARAAAPAECVSIILSDVIGDPLEAIASGPTAPDPTTFADALGVIDKYKIGQKIPAGILRYLTDGAAGKHPETLKHLDPVFCKIRNIVLGNNFEALLSAREKARELGYAAIILSSQIQGEAREVARVLAGLAAEVAARDLPVKKPACLLMGGETTVTLRGKGKGGRNQELALAALAAMKNAAFPFAIASCGTDGSDGPTDAAGGMISHELADKLRRSGESMQKYLDENDAYHFLEKHDALIKTGPTGTNVMDIIVALVGAQ